MGVKSKKMILKGVGNIFATNPLNKKEVITMGSLQNLRFDFTIEDEDIFGGDGLFPIDTLIQNKRIEISATDAMFDLNALKMMFGSQIAAATAPDQYLWSLNEGGKVTKTGDEGSYEYVYQPKYSASLFSDPAFSIRNAETGVLLEEIEEGAALVAGKFYWDSTDEELKFHADEDGVAITLSYKRADADVILANLMTDDIPCPVSIVHHGKFQQASGTLQGIETELYLCRASGTFSMDFARATASASVVNLKVVEDPLRGGRLGSIKRYELENNPCA